MKIKIWFSRGATMAVSRKRNHNDNGHFGLHGANRPDSRAASELYDLRELLVWVLEGFSVWAAKALEFGIYEDKWARQVSRGLTMAANDNNFDRNDFIVAIKRAIAARDSIKEQFLSAWKRNRGYGFNDKIPYCAVWKPETVGAIIEKATAGTKLIRDFDGIDTGAIRALVVDALCGFASCLEHGYQIAGGGREHFCFLIEAQARLSNDWLSIEDLQDLLAETGMAGIRVLRYLDEANARYGRLIPGRVPTAVRGNPSILVAGQDLTDLEDLLEQTRDKGIDVYTHGEMLPAHYRSYFKRFENLAGNFGSSWHLKKHDIERFHGPVLLTSNCHVQPPEYEQINRIFTTGPVGFPGCNYIPDRPRGGRKDFSEVVDLARRCPPPEPANDLDPSGFPPVCGFDETLDKCQVMAMAGRIGRALRKGKVNRLVVIVGTGPELEAPRRESHDTVIITAGMVRQGFTDIDFGDIDGIPRVFHAGQCNDCYAIAIMALELQKALGAESVNDLPISFDVRCHDQRAVLVLLSLISMGFRNIRVIPGESQPRQSSASDFLSNHFSLDRGKLQFEGAVPQ